MGYDVRRARVTMHGAERLRSVATTERLIPAVCGRVSGGANCDRRQRRRQPRQTLRRRGSGRDDGIADAVPVPATPVCAPQIRCRNRAR